LHALRLTALRCKENGWTPLSKLIAAIAALIASLALAWIAKEGLTLTYMTYAEERVPASYRLEKRSPPARYPDTLADRLNALFAVAFQTEKHNNT
jgi:hypothetical protein